jgi:MFS family permease
MSVTKTADFASGAVPADAAVATRGAPSIAPLVIGLATAALAMVCTFQGVQQVLIPDQVQAIDAAHKVGDLALLTTIAAALAVVGSVAGGALSDRTHSRFGRRTPWLVAMALISTVLMLVAGTLHDLTMIAIVYAALWFCLNFYQCALNAVIPDRVSEKHRGLVSSAFGLGGALGLGLGVNAVVRLSIEQGYIVLASLLIATTALCVVLIREGGRADLATPSPGLAVAPRQTWLSLLQPFHHRDFALAFVTRAASFTALSTIGGYTFYILQDHIGPANLPGHDVKGAVGILVGTQMVAWIVGVAAAGWLSDRLDRRKLFVGICSIGTAAAMMVPLLTATWAGILVFYALVGVFFGAYLAVDLALMTLVLPTRENEGRDLAVLSIANAGPQLLSPAIAATIISLAGYDALFWFGAVVSLLAGVAVFFIRSVR